MPEQLFKEIRTIEAEAAEIISDSEKKSAEILKKANEEAFKILANKEAELKTLKTKTMDKTLKESMKLRRKKLAKHKAELDALRAAANKRKDKATNLILQSLSKIVGE